MIRGVLDALHALRQAIASPRIIAFVWLLILVPALVAVWPFYAAVDANLAHHPGASYWLDQALDADFDRTNGAAIALLGGSLFCLLVGALLAGGILSLVGVRSVRCTFGEFAAECGRLFLRNTRVLFLGVVAALVLTWVLAVVRDLALGVLDGVDPGAGVLSLPWPRWVHVLEVGDYARGFAFVCLVFASKVAMVELALRRRRSALLAWCSAIATVVGQPFRLLGVVGGLVVAWLGGSFVFGELTAHFLEVRRDLSLGLLFGQLGMLWGATILVAVLLAARRFAAPAAQGDTPVVEPIVELPRVAPSHAKPPQPTVKVRETP